jgi:hypothetical protein
MARNKAGLSIDTMMVMDIVRAIAVAWTVLRIIPFNRAIMIVGGPGSNTGDFFTPGIFIKQNRNRTIFIYEI